MFSVLMGLFLAFLFCVGPAAVLLHPFGHFHPTYFLVLISGVFRGHSLVQTRPLVLICALLPHLPHGWDVGMDDGSSEQLCFALPVSQESDCVCCSSAFLQLLLSMEVTADSKVILKA